MKTWCIIKIIQKQMESSTMFWIGWEFFWISVGLTSSWDKCILKFKRKKTEREK
jgi:hypothetical protein